MSLKLSTDQASATLFGHAVGLPKSGIVLASGAYNAADPAPVEVTPPVDSVNVSFIVNVSAISGAGAQVTVEIDVWDDAQSGWVPVLTSAAINANGNTILKVGSNIAASANVAANQPLGQIMRVKFTKAGTTTTLSYSCSAQFSG